MPEATLIRIAAALIDDGQGRTLLVRKAGTKWFLQAGGKIEAGESPLDALCRELHEEIGLSIKDVTAQHLGCFTAPAANEPGRSVQAELFHVRTAHDPAPSLEIEEAIWADKATAEGMPLATLTRDHVLPLFSALTAGA
ncbi:8-oxo-dGTP diphosphatase [Sphingomonas sp. SORGH_AS 950]|uniref:NUDIX hydrolase n=1 Tax=Sphingomonas sp. SORGH_AS_0950 TaxID=3041792 RepID=UPI0027887D8E|nr:NUDIX domain-containing protein [Sphingomonas sp. SORGH_AS_0950]MDQ1159021.1 8-oxo-dGTP diphosphatase [Sphingomonas sp. SORGH_AS_0950]